MDYRARFYSVYLNHFTQPDLIVANPFNPQTLNRFSYVFNRPTIFIDPTGNLGKNGMICTDDGYCGTDSPTDVFDYSFGITFEGDWSTTNQTAVRVATAEEGVRLYDFEKGTSPQHAFQRVFNTGGGLRIVFIWDTNCYSCRSDSCINNNNYSGDCTPRGGVALGTHKIMFASMSTNFDFEVYNVHHEYGHVIDRPNYRHSSNLPTNLQNPRGFLYRQSTSEETHEIWADMWLHIMIDTPKTDPWVGQEGSNKRDWIIEYLRVNLAP